MSFGRDIAGESARQALKVAAWIALVAFVAGGSIVWIVMYLKEHL